MMMILMKDDGDDDDDDVSVPTAAASYKTGWNIWRST